jgi:peptidoglycan/LPS O-acetylase OafA/YrhL
MTLKERLDLLDNRPSGFDYLRLSLAISVIGWHTIIVCYGPAAETPIWTGLLRPLPSFIIPSFFALSGFLIAGSLERNTLPAFLTLRAVRIFPALAVEVLLSAFLVGSILTKLTLSEYFSDPLFHRYFLNVIGDIQYQLPGVFEGLPAGDTVNLQLWTVPIEMECYILISVIAIIGLVRRPSLLFATVLFGTAAILIKEIIFGGFPQLSRRPPDNMLVFSFLFGVCLYVLRKKVLFSWQLFIVTLAASWLLMIRGDTMYLATLPVAYVTVFLGLLNPPKTIIVAGADYSYGMYLYGFPVQQSLVYVFPGSKIWYINLVAGVLISGILAYCSWTFIESRLHKKRSAAVRLVQSLMTHKSSMPVAKKSDLPER